MRFAAAEIVPVFAKNLWVQGAANFLIGNRTPHVLKNALDKPMMRTIGVVTEEGKIDLDLLYGMGRQGFQGQPNLALDLPDPLGRITVRQSDLDKLYSYLGGNIDGHGNEGAGSPATGGEER